MHTPINKKNVICRKNLPSTELFKHNKFREIVSSIATILQIKKKHKIPSTKYNYNEHRYQKEYLYLLLYFTHIDMLINQHRVLIILCPSTPYFIEMLFLV